MDVLLRAARAYVERFGFELVVASAEKVPLRRFFPHGASSATADLKLLERALRASPGATLACRVGRERFALDVDVRHGGPEQLAQLLKTFGTLPPTWTARTPTGGLHIWFRGTGQRLRGQLAKGVEVIGGNRLVTISPSTRAGGRYAWTQHPLSTPLADAPRWLADAVTELPPPARRKPQAGTQDVATRQRRARAYLLRFEPAVAGQQGHTRTFLAAQILARGFELDEDPAFDLLSEWNERCVPPWSDRELRRKLSNALKRGRMEFGALLSAERSAA